MTEALLLGLIGSSALADTRRLGAFEHGRPRNSRAATGGSCPSFLLSA